MRDRLAPGVLIWLWAGACAAQGLDPVVRALELPAHAALMQGVDAGAPLAPFVTDGCSGGMTQAWQGVAGLFPDLAASHGDHPPWEVCCIAHDRQYHAAGGARSAADSFEARLAADRSLEACVQATAETRMPALVQTYGLSPEQVRAGYAAIAAAMFSAVRLGGGPCTFLPWRWGYGYPGCLWHPD